MSDTMNSYDFLKCLTKEELESILFRFFMQQYANGVRNNGRIPPYYVDLDQKIIRKLFPDESSFKYKTLLRWIQIEMNNDE